MTETETETMNLELGDIIKIVSPINETTNNKTYIINYIDENAIKLIDVDTTEDLILNINEDGNLNEEYIDEIILLDRSEMKGYVKQNNLEINNWIDIYFTGDIPFIITGMITNIEEDMIEIITFENNETIYIDFAYQGIPTDLNIKEIAKRDKPVTNKEDEETNVIDDIETEDYELDTYIIPDTIDISKLQPIIPNFLLNCSREWLYNQLKQGFGWEPSWNLPRGDIFPQFVSMWTVSQRDGEYNPIHTHPSAAVSGVLYLKIPEYKEDKKDTRKPHKQRTDDGSLVFTNNSGAESIMIRS